MPDTISTGVGIDVAGVPAPRVDASGGVVDVDGCTASATRRPAPRLPVTAAEVEAFLAVVEPEADAALFGCTGPIAVVDPFL
jgi:hypothetical protein